MIWKEKTYKELVGAGVPDQVLSQIRMSLRAVNRSWHAPQCYRGRPIRGGAQALAAVTLTDLYAAPDNGCHCLNRDFWLYDQSDAQTRSQKAADILVECIMHTRRVQKNIAAENVSASYIASQQKVLARVARKVEKLPQVPKALADEVAERFGVFKETVDSLTVCTVASEMRRRREFDKLAKQCGNPKDNGFVVIAGYANRVEGSVRRRMLRSLTVAADGERFAVVVPMWAFVSLWTTREAAGPVDGLQVEVLSPPAVVANGGVNDVIAWCRPSLERWCAQGGDLVTALEDPTVGLAVQPVVDRTAAAEQLFGSALG